RFASVIGLFLMLGGVVPATWAQQPIDWTSRLATVQDQALRRTLENSISAGLIADEADFNTAVARAQSRFAAQNPTALYAARGNNNGNAQSIRDAIAKSTALIAKLDRDAVDVKKVDGTRGKLFQPLTGSLPASYEAAYKLALLFNPRVGTDDTGRLNSQIDTFLASIADDPVIKQALQSTGTKMADLKRNWFGSGAGFEHVICGEIKGSEVSGYHWWYKFYRDEQTGNTQYVNTLGNAGSEYAYTGAFTWDPDGSGPLPTARKKKGGFIVGNSVQAILALGHIAMESARKFGSIPGALTFDADVNGQTFTWQLYTMGGTIRSLYPMGGKNNMPEPDDIAREYYDLEGEALQGVNPEASLTVH
ncbi:MAG TPA: hypothetical protein PKM25_16150, partial [Candidatus Ozemobacteraceae bacterium]|nr:hypothetical protein [Candidatus Ozemobacteraceae bacterium]